ncbi:hypothetical protein [Marisediminicola sp. LYQ85]|uniref:hypothetical protein n=1 Tax=Marisediminicola sp. LYQ85 TaxID=3391062 RepID=UPI003982F565
MSTERASMPSWRARLAALGAAGVLVAGAAMAPQPVEANFTNSEFARGTVTAATVNPPLGLVGAPTVIGCSTNFFGNMTLTWRAPSGGITPTAFRVELFGAGSTPVYSTTAPATTLSRTINADLLGGLLGEGNYTARVTTIASGDQWTWSSTSTLDRNVRITILGGWSCNT